MVPFEGTPLKTLPIRPHTPSVPLSPIVPSCGSNSYSTILWEKFQISSTALFQGSSLPVPSSWHLVECPSSWSKTSARSPGGAPPPEPAPTLCELWWGYPEPTSPKLIFSTQSRPLPCVYPVGSTPPHPRWLEGFITEEWEHCTAEAGWWQASSPHRCPVRTSRVSQNCPIGIRLSKWNISKVQVRNNANYLLIISEFVNSVQNSSLLRPRVLRHLALRALSALLKFGNPKEFFVCVGYIFPYSLYYHFQLRHVQKHPSII